MIFICISWSCYLLLQQLWQGRIQHYSQTLSTLLSSNVTGRSEKRENLPYYPSNVHLYARMLFLARFSIWKLMEFWMSSVPVWSYRRCGIRYSFEGRDRLQSCAFKGQNPALHLTIFGLDDGWPRQWRSGFSIVSRMIFFCFKSTD